MFVIIKTLGEDFVLNKGNKIKWNGTKKIKWKKTTHRNIIVKNKRKGSQRELKRDACEINCREVVFWSSIQQFYELKKVPFFSKYLTDIVFGVTSN